MDDFPHRRTKGSAAYAFGDPTTTVGDQITVIDAVGQKWDFLDTGAVRTLVTYGSDPPGRCTAHTATASTVDATVSASSVATVCVGADLGLTRSTRRSSDGTVAGTIEITNPNDWESVLASVEVAPSASGHCSVAVAALRPPNFDGRFVVVAPSSALDVGYICTTGLGSRTGPVSVAWPDVAAATPEGSISIT